MARKRITELFPFLLPARQAQRKAFFYAGMAMDGAQYAREYNEESVLYTWEESQENILDEASGIDMEYQQNRLYNIARVAKCMDGLRIAPGETFSFWQVARHARGQDGFRDGPAVENNKLVYAPGGGICQLSTALFRLFLCSPLEIVERHTHSVQTMRPREDEVRGCDAAVNEGWLDLKAHNATRDAFVLRVQVFQGKLHCALLCEAPQYCSYTLFNRNVSFYRRGGELIEEAEVCRRRYMPQEDYADSSLLFTNKTAVAYHSGGHALPSREALVEAN